MRVSREEGSWEDSSLNVRLQSPGCQGAEITRTYHATFPSVLITRADLHWNKMKALTCSLLSHIFLSFTQRNKHPVMVSHTACLTPGFCFLTLLVTRCKRQCESITVTGNMTQETHVIDGRSEQGQDSEASKMQLDSGVLIPSWATSCLPLRLRHNRIEHRPIPKVASSLREELTWKVLHNQGQNEPVGFSSWAI